MGEQPHSAFIASNRASVILVLFESFCGARFLFTPLCCAERNGQEEPSQKVATKEAKHREVQRYRDNQGAVVVEAWLEELRHLNELPRDFIHFCKSHSEEEFREPVRNLA